MNGERLVAMANDIAAFFDSEPDKEIAAAQVAAHLKRYWDPRMRRDLVSVASAGPVGLAPIAARAVELCAYTA